MVLKPSVLLTSIYSMLTTFFYLLYFFFQKTFFFLPSSFIKNHLVNLNSYSFHLIARAVNSTDRYISSAEPNEHHTSLEHVTSWSRNPSSLRLIEWEKLNIFFAAETRHRSGNSSYRARADMPSGERQTDGFFIST